MTHALALTAMVFYVAASALMLLQVWKPALEGAAKKSRLQTWGIRLFLGGLVAHTGTLIAIINDPRFVFLDDGGDYFFWVSWGIAIAFAALSKLNYPIVGAFLVPAVVLFMGSSSYLLHGGTRVVESNSEPLAGEHLLSLMHAIPAFVSLVSLALAFVVSAVFLVVERRLKRKGIDALNLSGPNLQLLDSLNRRLVQLGFVAISLVVLSGGLWAVSQRKPLLAFDTSVVSGLVIWILLAFILHVRLVLKWSPKRISRLTIIVTGCFFISVFAVILLAGRLTHASFSS